MYIKASISPETGPRIQQPKIIIQHRQIANSSCAPFFFRGENLDPGYQNLGVMQGASCMCRDSPMSNDAGGQASQTVQRVALSCTTAHVQGRATQPLLAYLLTSATGGRGPASRVNKHCLCCVCCNPVRSRAGECIKTGGRCRPAGPRSDYYY